MGQGDATQFTLGSSSAGLQPARGALTLVDGLDLKNVGGDPHGSGKGRRLRGGRRSRKDERPRRRNGERRALGRAGPDPFPEQEDPERQESREQQAFFHVVLRARDWAGGFRAHGTGSNPPGRNGWQRTSRDSASHAPRRKP